MNNVEFDTAFDVMYNNITSNQAPGLNLYEKSLFLTQAQSHIIREYFNPRIDQAGGGYDGNQKRQYDFSCLTKHADLTEISPSNKFDTRSLVYKFPSDWFLTLNEQLISTSTVTVQNVPTSVSKNLTVYPLSMDEYDRLMSKPYKLPPKGSAWRLITEHTWDEEVQVTTPRYRTFRYTFNIIPDASLEESEDIVLIFTESGSSFYINVVATSDDFKIESDESCVTIYVPTTFKISEMMEAIKVYMVNNLNVLTGSSFIIEYGDDYVGNTELSEIGYFDGKPILSIFMQDTHEQSSGDIVTFTETSIELIVNNNDITNTPQNPLVYKMRYIRKPKPIILENIIDYGISIDGETNARECELPEVIHKEILERAVVMAKSVWMANTQQQNNQNERSER